MSRVLSDEEINALLELFQADAPAEAEQQRSLVEHDLQRRFFRSSQNLPASLTAGGRTHTVTATNLSLGGVFVRTSLPVAIGAEVDLALVFPEPSMRIKVHGSVCWQKKSGAEPLGLGIRFPSLSTEAIWAIIAHIEQARKPSP
ncbi:MAG: PilZ domain-containing protein [Desulfobacteraceae bacterium]|nr:PilZ domain-containing protein [Desulfobacteraceae bacterium]